MSLNSDKLNVVEVFQADTKILNPDSNNPQLTSDSEDVDNTISFKNERLYLDKFKYHRKAMEYILLFHSSLIFSFFITHKYSDFNKAWRDKLNTAKYLLFFYLFMSFTDDLLYSLYKSKKEESIIRQFLNYEREFMKSIKNLEYKKLADKILIKPKPKYKPNNDIVSNYYEKENIFDIKDTHLLLSELEITEKKYKEKLELLSYRDVNYAYDYAEVQSLRIRKREIERRILEVKKKNYKYNC